MRARRGAAAALLLACLAAPGGAADAKPDRPAADLMDVVMWNREPIGGPFRLTDHAGRVRRDTDFRGKLMLVYFGFTLCPDICPTDLQQIAGALRLLGPEAREVAPLFITLDPERDTQKLLAEYAPAFHPQLIGLTGSLDAVLRAARAYKVYRAKVTTQGWSSYTIDHSSFVYLMGRDGKYLGFIPPGTSAERIATAIKPHLAPAAAR
jgi:protein SCO1/2